MSQSPEQPWLSPRNGKFTPWMSQGQFSHAFGCLNLKLWLLVSHTPGHKDTGSCPVATVKQAPRSCLDLCLSAHMSTGIALTVPELHLSLHTNTLKLWKIQGNIFFCPVVHWIVMWAVQKRSVTQSALGSSVMINRKAFWMMPLLSKQHSLSCWTSASKKSRYWIINFCLFSHSILMIHVL